MSTFKYSLINQEKVTKQIIADLDNKLFSNSIIISGDKYSGKMTLAVELASYLANFDYLNINNNNTIILSNRDTAIRLRALYNVAEEEQTHASYQNLIHEIYRTLHSFSPLFKPSKTEEVLYNIAGELNEELIYFSQEFSPESFKKLKKPLFDLIAKYKGGFSIEQIKNIGTYMYSNSETKVIILEGIEYSSIGAINSLLKILEEPEKNTYFILVTSNYNQIIDTIRSRVRKYECTSGVLDNIREQYLKMSGLEIQVIKDMSSTFITTTVVNKKRVSHELIDNIVETDPNLDIFIPCIIDEIKKLNIVKIKQIKIINTVYNMGMIYNQNKKTILDLLQRSLC